MFDELNIYKESGRFIMTPKDKEESICNAPTDKSGVYIVYALRNGKIELVYIGSSGKLNADGSMFIETRGYGGIKESIVNGHQFGKAPRLESWAEQMKKEKTEFLDVYWYITHTKKYADCPGRLEYQLQQLHLDVFGHLPRWNIEL